MVSARDYRYPVSTEVDASHENRPAMVGTDIRSVRTRLHSVSDGQSRTPLTDTGIMGAGPEFRYVIRGAIANLNVTAILNVTTIMNFDMSS